jgi:hypothetical protein
MPYTHWLNHCRVGRWQGDNVVDEPVNVAGGLEIGQVHRHLNGFHALAGGQYEYESLTMTFVFTQNSGIPNPPATRHYTYNVLHHQWAWQEANGANPPFGANGAAPAAKLNRCLAMAQATLTCINSPAP